jgi:dTDP-4-dehydrorhamnose 3,5-epimerase
MKFTRLAIPDLILCEPRVWEDGRGSFFELYHRESFVRNGIPDVFVQDNESCSQKGVLRGLHYQIPPKAQSKLIRVVRGRIFDVAVDIRKNSPTFGKHIDLIMEEGDRRMLYVPVGFAHGFCALEDRTEVIYKVSEFYSPEHERGIRWDDPSIEIKWPLHNSDLVLSEKDRLHPVIESAGPFF